MHSVVWHGKLKAMQVCHVYRNHIANIMCDPSGEYYKVLISSVHVIWTCQDTLAKLCRTDYKGVHMHCYIYFDFPTHYTLNII